MATFDSKTIVMMAENGHSVEIDGKKIQLTIVQEAGGFLFDKAFLENATIKQHEYILGVDTYDKDALAYCFGRKVDGVFEIMLSKTMRDENKFKQEVENLAKYFDLSNPLDHNPDDVRVFDVPSEIEIFEDEDGMYLRFSRYQALWYNSLIHSYGVFTGADTYTPIPCIATECKFEDLKEGDLFFATDQKTPDFSCLFEYNFLNKNNKLIWTDGSNIAVANKSYTHYFKITPKP